MNEDCSLKERSQALRLLLNLGINTTRARGYDSIQAVIHDDNYFKILQKHYGFKKTEGTHISCEV